MIYIQLKERRKKARKTFQDKIFKINDIIIKRLIENMVILSLLKD